MTDYDAAIARLKLDAMRQLKTNLSLPFSVAPGDSPRAWDVILNKVMGPALGSLLGALIDRDRWKRSAEEMQIENDHLLNQLGAANDALELERADRFMADDDQLIITPASGGA